MLEEAMVLNATNFNSSYLENKGNDQFELRPLPRQAQFSTVYGIHTGDFTRDGIPDLILAGNFSGFRIKYGNYDANRGLLLAGDGQGNFSAVSNQISGLNIRGEVRDIAVIRISPGRELLIFARNNDHALIYEFNSTP
jgi:enediyne biosynthesis protein E4